MTEKIVNNYKAQGLFDQIDIAQKQKEALEALILALKYGLEAIQRGCSHPGWQGEGEGQRCSHCGWRKPVDTSRD